MVRIKVTLGIGMQGKQEDILEFDDDVFAGMTEEQKEEFLEQEYREWTYNYIDGHWEEIE